MKSSLALLILLLALPAVSAEPDAAARTEIAHLLKYLETSGCQFQRNGSWFAPERASDHLNQKYEYLLKKGLVTSAETFIERAGTQSSQSGKPYAVKCGDAAPVPSGDWLREELQRFRAKKEN
ncbi:MAG TPA: DUF5329 domain-containing protein [Steroidobacteraceae bacterium]|nr:DUF5329 domain-containing protein [Steroidobacteraceae bacterium]